MSSLVTELHIIGENNNIFDTEMEYIIPLYQRAYAWEDKQLTQLVEDIEDVAEDANYYIGSLIVSKQNGRYEVVDPGTFDGSYVRLFDKLTPNPYYRAFNEI